MHRIQYIWEDFHRFWLICAEIGRFHLFFTKSGLLSRRLVYTQVWTRLEQYTDRVLADLRDSMSSEIQNRQGNLF